VCGYVKKKASSVDRLLITVINKMAAYTNISTEPIKAIIEYESIYNHSYHLGGEYLCKLRDVINHKFTHYDVCTSSILAYNKMYKIKVVTGDIAIVEEIINEYEGVDITRHIDKSNIEFLHVFGNDFIAVRLYQNDDINKSKTGSTALSWQNTKSIYPNDILFEHVDSVEWA